VAEESIQQQILSELESRLSGESGLSEESIKALMAELRLETPDEERLLTLIKEDSPN
jgi:hypothetical protein